MRWSFPEMGGNLGDTCSVYLWTRCFGDGTLKLVTAQPMRARENLEREGHQ
jgi:hypothetical protein